jgi:hypothetical protein
LDDRDVDVAKLTFLKDGIVAEYQARLTWWQMVLAAALAGISVATAGAVQGALGPRPAAVLGPASASFLALALLQRHRSQVDFEVDLRTALVELETLQRRRG